jgi:hypothetical protein
MLLESACVHRCFNSSSGLLRVAPLLLLSFLRGWVQHTWEALYTTPLHLKGPLATVKSQRVGDQHLMDALMELYNDTTSSCQQDKLLCLNNCCLHLQVTLLSDIASANGLRIDSSYYKGQSSPQRVCQSKRWPKTYPPTQTDWILWKDALHKAFCLPNNTFRALASPLGEWLSPDDQDWIWWHSPDQRTLFEQLEDGSWQQWQRVTSQGLRLVMMS